jgi:hypothetical protein
MLVYVGIRTLKTVEVATVSKVGLGSMGQGRGRPLKTVEVATVSKVGLGSMGQGRGRPRIKRSPETDGEEEKEKLRTTAEIDVDCRYNRCHR